MEKKYVERKVMELKLYKSINIYKIVLILKWWKNEDEQ